jgi:hypothetical protein
MCLFFLQEEDETKNEFALDSPAVELFLSPVGGANSPPKNSESLLPHDMDSSHYDDSPRDEDTKPQKTPGNSGRGKKKGAKHHRKSWGGGAM